MNPTQTQKFPAEASRTRHEGLDAFRGFLILCVVVGHSDLLSRQPALASSFLGSILLKLVAIVPPIYYFHMGGFFVLSAVVATPGSIGTTLKRVLPLLSAYVFWLSFPIILYVLEAAASGNVKDWIGFLLGPVAKWAGATGLNALIGNWHSVAMYWFIPAFISFLVLLAAFLRLRDTITTPWIRITVSSLPFVGLVLMTWQADAIAKLHVIGAIPWGLDIALFILPFGLLAREVSLQRLSTTPLIWLFGGILLGEALITLFEPVKTHSRFPYRIDFAQYSMPTTLLGLLGFTSILIGLLGLFSKLERGSILAFVGRFSMPIYLIHYQILTSKTLSSQSAFSTMISGWAEETNKGYFIVLRIFASVAVPIALSLLFLKVWRGSRWFGFTAK